MKLAPYSQLGLVITPDNFDLTSGDLPEYGPLKYSKLEKSGEQNIV